MTTKCTVMNHGPAKIKVSVVSKETMRRDGSLIARSEKELKPGEFVDTYYVHSGEQIVIDELTLP